jgi:HEAT repeat protein
VSEGLETTLDLLAKTENEAAVSVLIPALESRYRVICEGALRAILARRSLAGHREIIRRLHRFDRGLREMIRERRNRMAHALRDAVLSTDKQMCINGCRAALWLGEYDLIPSLLNVLSEREGPNVEMVCRTLLELVEALYSQLANADQKGYSRSPESARGHALAALELSVDRFAHHQRREVIEAFAMLVNRDNVTLKRILQDRHNAAFKTLVDVLTKSQRGGVIRLLLALLDDPHVPSAALSLLGDRHDLKYLRYLLRKIGREPSDAAARNLKRIESIAWLRSGKAIFDQLDDLAQHGAVRLVMVSGVPRLQAFGVVEYLLRHGKPGGRRAAAEALCEFHGAEANALALTALDDEDPEVQANVISQLRGRGIPGVLGRLVEKVNSPQAVVRRATQEALAEFSFKRFLAAFDMLDDEVRRSTGMLMRKLDPQAIPQLKAEMTSKMRTRRLRALGVTQAMNVVAELEPSVIKLLGDEDHLVRVEAAVTLSRSKSPTAREALEVALEDRSLAVREAAQEALHGEAQFADWREALSDPRD